MRYAVGKKIPFRKTDSPNKGGGYHVQVFATLEEVKKVSKKYRKIPDEIAEDHIAILDLFR